VLAYEKDGVAPPGPAIRAAHRAPHGQVAHLPGGHYAAFTDAEQQTAQAMLSFLDRQVRESSGTVTGSSRSQRFPRQGASGC
jgi:uncharacterized protein